MSLGRLHFFCGKMGAGKTTASVAIAEDNSAILLCEDAWLAALYPGLISSPADYAHYAGLLRPQIKVLVQSLLQQGQDVVLDFPGNTEAQRAGLKAISDEVGAEHNLYFLDVADERCLAQIEARAATNVAKTGGAKTDTADMFWAMNKYFMTPRDDEGLNIIKL